MTEFIVQVGEVAIRPEIAGGMLQSLGAVQVGSVALRNCVTRFLPWFDTYAGDVFRLFRWLGCEQRGRQTVLATRAVSDPDVLFREQRDSSGDLCFRNANWDDSPLETDFDIVFEPVATTIDGRSFTGFKYWFEYRSPEIPIHRIVDRQTWEVGGNLDDVALVLRNWLTPPRVQVRRETTYSTVGLDQWAALLPGNLWGRWSMLPPFDMQYGKAGVLLAWFDAVSLVRTVIESNAGEDCLRCLDMHLFEQATTVRTNPKTVVWSPDVLDDVDALNLWTRMTDAENDKARRQFGIRAECPPAVIVPHTNWIDIDLNTTYEKTLAVAAEFGADYLGIDPVWENEQTLWETIRDAIPETERAGSIVDEYFHECQCGTLDFRVAAKLGGETALKGLCDRAAKHGIAVISWLATHLSSDSGLFLKQPELGHGMNGLYAAKESGRHPDTGYASGCWPLNLNAPVFDYVKAQLLGVCERTGLGGFLWDSFCNLGWWQIDYSNGTMRPQFDRMSELYAALANAGLYLMPEALVAFSAHSCCGLHGGDIYAGDLLGYSYSTNIALWFGDSGSHDTNAETRILRGQAPVDDLFRAFSHKRIPPLNFASVPRDQWHAESARALRELITMYKGNRHLMQRRTVLKNGLGVRWDNDQATPLFFAFVDQPGPATAVDAATGLPVTGGRLLANHAYRLPAAGTDTPN